METNAKVRGNAALLAWICLALAGITVAVYWPVIGLVQVGDQTMADRYSYLPPIGIFIVVVWAGAGLAARYRMVKWLAPAAAMAMRRFLRDCGADAGGIYDLLLALLERFHRF